jgi:GT2 family glycosyltransferase
VIVVDDGSTDGTYQYLEENYPEIILLQGDGNLWWAGATNEGVKKALELSSSNEDFILTLNNDLVVVEEYLQELVNVAIKDKPCIVGSVSVNIKNTSKVEFAGLKWNKITAKYSRPKEFKENYKDLRSGYLTIDTDLLPGRGTLIPISLFKQIGLFDVENFPHYAADDDFSLRGKNFGFKLVVATRAVVKSYVDESGLEVINRTRKGRKTLAHLRESLSSIRSGTNLSIRYNWAKKHTPVPPLYFMFDFMRIVYSFYFK